MAPLFLLLVGTRALLLRIPPIVHFVASKVKFCYAWFVPLQRSRIFLILIMYIDYSFYLLLSGRILFGGYFALMGINHFTKMGVLSGYAGSKGVLAPKAAVAVTGLFLLIGGLGILLGGWITLSVVLLSVFLLAVSFKVHAFWKDADPQARMVDMQHFMKNMALLGAVLMLPLIPLPWFLSIF